MLDIKTAEFDLCVISADNSSGQLNGVGFKYALYRSPSFSRFTSVGTARSDSARDSLIETSYRYNS